MDPEIKVTSAAEAPEIELTSAAEDLENKLTSAAATEGPEIELTSDAEGLLTELTYTTDSLNFYHPPFATTESPDCIFRASARIRYGRESDFEPKLVSIGPYYHGRGNLKRMEDFKVRCMSDILKIRLVGESNIDRVPVDRFMRFESNARRFYKEKFDLSDVKFVEMLVLDSFFVIRILLSLSKDDQESMTFLDLNIKEAVSDLLLLENQIPLFFITEVFSWLFHGSICLLFDLVLETFMRLDLPWWINSDGLPINSDGWPINSDNFPIYSDHLLHLYWKISEASITKKIKEDYAYPVLEEDSNTPGLRIRCPSQKLIANATELNQMAGINFENTKIDGYNGVYVDFSRGIMRMPCLKIDSSQTTLLVNLVAFESSMLSSNRTMSTYIKIMDDLIDSDKDVELLQKSGVIYNTLSSHTKAATFFNDIGNHCFIDYKDNPFSNLFKNVNKYYKSSWNRSWANLRQNYFNSPWAGISVLAGVTLLFLSAVQTYYTVFPKN